MDSARFGRALGVGARHAARSLLEAADAAAAPAPTRPSAAPPFAAAPARPAPPVILSPVPARTPPRATAATAAAAPPTAAASARGIAEGGRRFRHAVLAPATRAGGILWLEFTGVFFGLFALVSAIATWRLHNAWHLSSDNAHQHAQLLIALALTLLFGYFCASSFHRAGRRSRRP